MSATSASAAVISKTLGLANDADASDPALLRTRALLEENQSAEQQCNICLDVIPAAAPTWACRHCFALFDLRCAQGWAVQCRQAQRASFVPKDDAWYCPACRASYSPEDVPQRYTCFCGAVHDPPLDPWLAPHSCGGQCGAELACGHSCSLLCHPGPHPACARTLDADCFCGRKRERKRCAHASWSCGAPCGAVLECREHRCESACHSGDCPPCVAPVAVKCRCGSSTAQRPCFERNSFLCDAVCRRLLDCGRHFCEKVCCAGDCGPCLLNGPRFCPCGQEKFTLPCDQPTPVCGRTCNKWLACTKHRCGRLCHANECGPCIETETMPCRCGAKRKPQPCGTVEFRCDIRCNELRNCGRHRCRQRCCPPGGCRRCEEVCGRALACGNHSCALLCHDGPCAPCPGVAVVFCSCGRTKRKVACGKERSAAPPRCDKPCTKPSTCHHPTSAKKPHPCHPADIACPPCDLPCGLSRPNQDPLAGCGHVCQAPCHAPPPSANNSQSKPERPAAVAAPSWPAVADKQAASSGAAAAAATASASVDSDRYKCPPCASIVKRRCLGAHEERSVPCSSPVAFACKQPCRQPLRCGNHFCTLPCHALKQPDTPAGARKPWDVSVASGCKQCEARCTRPREGLVRPCTHGCLFGCHTTPCPPCDMLVTIRCRCYARTGQMQCKEYTTMSEEELQASLHCANRCERRMACGHRCPRTCCVEGECAPAPECSKRLALRCACGARREELSCREAQALPGAALPADPEDAPFKPTLPCDEKCKVKPQRQSSEPTPKTSAAAPAAAPAEASVKAETPPADPKLTKRAASAKMSSNATHSSKKAAPAPLPKTDATLSFFARSQLFAALSRSVNLTDRQLERAVRWVTVAVVLALVAFLAYVLLVM